MGLTAEQVSAFREEGVLVVERVLAEADLAPVIDEYSRWIDCRAHDLVAEGKLTNLYEDAPFERRLGLLYAQTPEISRDLDIMFVRGPATFDFLRNAHLLDAVESLIGTEITCNPISTSAPSRRPPRPARELASTTSPGIRTRV